MEKSATASASPRSAAMFSLGRAGRARAFREREPRWVRRRRVVWSLVRASCTHLAYLAVGAALLSSCGVGLS